MPPLPKNLSLTLTALAHSNTDETKGNELLCKEMVDVECRKGGTYSRILYAFVSCDANKYYK